MGLEGERHAHDTWCGGGRGADLMQRSCLLTSGPKLLLSVTSTSVTGTSWPTPTDRSQDTSRSPSWTLSVPEGGGPGGGGGAEGRGHLQHCHCCERAHTNGQFVAGRLGEVLHDWRADVARPQEQDPPARGGHGRHPHPPRSGAGDACSLHPWERRGMGGRRPLEYRQELGRNQRSSVIGGGRRAGRAAHPTGELTRYTHVRAALLGL